MTMISTQSILSVERVQSFVQDWFVVLNRRVPVEDLLRFLARDGLVMRMPDVTLRDHEQVRIWYRELCSRPPGHVLEPQDVRIRLTSPLHAEVTMTVRSRLKTRWPGRWMSRPDATHNWSLVVQDDTPKIRTYDVFHLIAQEKS